MKYSFPSHLFMVVKMIIGLCGECFDMIGLLAFYYSGGAAAYVAVPPLMWRRCRLCGGAAAYVAALLLMWRSRCLFHSFSFCLITLLIIIVRLLAGELGQVQLTLPRGCGDSSWGRPAAWGRARGLGRWTDPVLSS